MFFAFDPFCEFQILTYTTAISDLGNTLIICSFEIRTTLLNRSIFLRTALMVLELISSFVLSAI